MPASDIFGPDLDPSMNLTLNIPSISDRLLWQFGSKIRPVIKRAGKLFYVEPTHTRNASFLHSYMITSEALGLQEVAVLKTLHTYGRASMLFQPTVAEVIAQIPIGYAEQAVAYLTGIRTVNMTEWSPEEDMAWRAGYHLADTTLFEPIPE